jgi:hypothetical protein
MNDQDETDIDAIEHEGEAEEQRTTATPADVYGGVLALIGMIQNPRAFKSRLKELRQAEAAANKAAADLVTAQAARAAFEQHKAAELAEIQMQTDRAQKRMDAAEFKESNVAEREQRIHKLEQRWKFVNEDEQVRSGFREAENGTPLEKARAAYGLSDDAPVSEPLPDGNDPAFSEGMPPGATLTRAAQTRPARSQRARAEQ